MPAVSDSQQRFMGMCLHNRAHAYGHCPSEKVAREFATTGGNKNLPEKKSNPDKGRGSKEK